MLHKKRKPNTGGTLETMIGAGTSIDGDVAFEGGLRIDGTVQGTVSAPDGSGSRLVISDQAVVEGEVQVPNVIINGRVKGNVHASERLELHARSRVEGDLFYEVIKMEEGAEIRGTCSQVPGTKEGKAGHGIAAGPAKSGRGGAKTSPGAAEDSGAEEGSGQATAKTSSKASSEAG